jgi:uncharacterized protein
MADRHEVIRTILAESKRIAVVGASDRAERPSNQVTAQLIERGYDVTPVNPRVVAVHGEDARPSLAEVTGPLDIVDVFRRAEHAPDVARQAVEVSARALWLQQGVRSEEARRIAEDGGLLYVEDACLAVEVDRFSREMPLPPPT